MNEQTRIPDGLLNTTPPKWSVEDKSGRGLIGLTAGLLIGFFGSYYWLIPLLPQAKTVPNVTIMTTVASAAMVIGGAAGYIATRKK